jgi:DNA-binding LacI/PurR family transcriptional regulator
MKTSHDLDLKKKIPTSMDVARLAKVSQSTVSRAFSNATNLLPETRELVFEAAKQIGYRPNAIARSLVSNRTNIIGLLIMRNASPFYNQITDAMALGSNLHGYNLMIIRQMEGERGADTLARALDYRVDGVVITAIEDTDSVGDICKSSKVPIILLNRYIEGAVADMVCCDNFAAGQMVSEFLSGRGHKRIACIMGDPKASTTKDRLEGMRDKAKALNLEIISVSYGDYSYTSGQATCRKYIEAHDGQLPDVFFCSGDIIAFAVMDVLRFEYHYRVPEDISVIGFDDIAEASWTAYNLTTVRQPFAELVDSTYRLLEKRINEVVERNGFEYIRHKCELVVRNSVSNLRKT